MQQWWKVLFIVMATRMAEVVGEMSKCSSSKGVSLVLLQGKRCKMKAITITHQISLLSPSPPPHPQWSTKEYFV